MAARSSLLGPPELHDPTLLTQKKSQQNSTQANTDRFMDLMIAKFNETVVDTMPIPEMTITKRRSPTYESSGNPCLDFFYHVVPDTPISSIKNLLCSAWEKNPLTTLKLICNLRGIRGTGKSDKEGFYGALIWLHQFHPKTLACNISCIARFGYLKDLPEILYRLLEGHEVRARQKADWQRRKSQGCGPGMRQIHGGTRMRQLHGGTRQGPFQKAKGLNRTKLSVTREIRIANSVKRNQIEKEKASKLRNQRRVDMAKKVYKKFNQDPDFRYLYQRISDFFAGLLKADMAHLKSGDIRNISLAAKWCPSLDSSFDRSILLCESIARNLFPRESYCEYEGVEESHYAYRIRDRLRKEVLVPLRKVLELPEVYIGANKWSEIPYNRVSSVAMKLYKERFLKHNFKRFSNYLKDVKSNKAKIAADALLPHEIISSLNDDDGGQVAELQWKNKKKKPSSEDGTMRKLKNCIAICDVSSEMIGTPMEASIALGLLISELSDKPWKGKIITFSDNPKLQVIQGKTLFEKIEFVRKINIDSDCNFQKVFDLILKVAVEGKLKEDEMIKTVFVFSDMDFSRESSNGNETNYQVIVRNFREKGYQKVIPEIVFWNLRNSKATPVIATQNGTALVSGFSKNLMKLFLDREGEMTPLSIMEAAISGEEYQNLAVVD
ncbi:uncharacterized protein LOC126680592 [Mercurialis annua]|uniref:uncharacterized protein LOC126680592 n=1 Tax=Mercurialis annua TaxID=3986 RepID=UPI00215FC11A|nr:uncharacterized protein LOC126680592 [Mercurialis annua]